MPFPLFPLVAAAAGAAAGAAVSDRRAMRRMARTAAAPHADVVQRPDPEELSGGQHRERVLAELLLERPDPEWRDPAPVATNLILARLLPEDHDAVVEALEGSPADLWAQVGEPGRRRLTLNFAAHYGIEGALERAGLRAEMPPEQIHAMARGPSAAGGDPFLSDVIFDAVDHSGLAVPQGGTVLDFGASSGRVLRSVAAARPDVRCLGCDPNAEAIAWADEFLPMAEFFVSPQAPPLDVPDASVDLVYAISIWSHFAEQPALDWLAEMHRILVPGGALVMTTHGYDCLSVQLRNGWVSSGTATGAVAAMITRGHHFVDVFGPDGDWGVQDAGWGNAYLTLDWLQAQAGDRFATRLLWPGYLDRIQDVIVLECR